MGKIKYLLRCIKQLDYKNMFKIAKGISKKTKKSYIFIVLDIIRCGLVYQAGYYDYQEFEFYNLSKKERKTYLTRGKNNEIIKKFNNKDSFYIFEDKSEFYKRFDKFIKRNWLVLNENNEEEFLNFFSTNKTIIVKPINGEGGKGVEKFEYKNAADAKKTYKQLLKNEQLLVEQCIVQHPELAKLYSKSVNTMRMFTFYKDGESHFLQAILKLGNGGVIDNFSSGGMYTYADNQGTVYVEAIDREDNIFYEHPISKQKIVGFKIPMFKEAVELVKEAAKVVPSIGYVGWDVAITNDGPVIIEGNCYPGVFQVKASLSNVKEGLIPKYNEIMKIF